MGSFRIKDHMSLVHAEIKHLPGTNIVDGNLFSQVHFLYQLTKLKNTMSNFCFPLPLSLHFLSNVFPREGIVIDMNFKVQFSSTLPFVTNVDVFFLSTIALFICVFISFFAHISPFWITFRTTVSCLHCSHVSHKGQGAATIREKGQDVTRTRAGAAP
jgi:hypothetical protein